MRVAAVDIGSNTILLLIAEKVESGELVRVRDECRFGRLSQGLDKSGRLTPEAIARCLDFLREYRQYLNEVDVTAIAVAATEAVRKAENAAEFVAPAQEILGAPVEVIPGEREAELVYKAVSCSLPELASQEFVIVDVGGASTEFIIGSGAGVKSCTSLPIGAVRLAERHLHSDPAAADEGRALIADIDGVLGELELPTGALVIGTSGTATSLGSVELKLREYDPDRVHGLKLAPAEVERQLAKYLELTVAEKRALPGLEPARADVIAAGAAIYARVLHRVRAPELVVSDRGVRWGLAYELAEKHG